jgi:hypothetical protein
MNALMTEIFEWAEQNSRKYPELDLLCEANVDGEIFVNLPVKYGVYPEQYYCLEENPSVKTLREQGYAVGIVENYGIMRTLILECVGNLKKKRRRENKNKTNNS